MRVKKSVEEIKNMFDLSGQVAVVTGGSGGAGRAIANALALYGGDVVVTSRNQTTCADVVGKVEALGRQVLAVSCDMNNWSEIDSLVERTYDRFGRCDVLVNNAGVSQITLSLSEMSESFFDQIQAVNLKGPLHLASLVAPRMGESGGGTIINVISTAGIEPVSLRGAYTASKSALRALTRVMAEEWASVGVRVNAIAPGGFLTGMMRREEEQMPGVLKLAARATMLKRLGDPEEIVGPVLFLAGEASSYVTGQTLSVCGGLLKS